MLLFSSKKKQTSSITFQVIFLIFPIVFNVNRLKINIFNLRCFFVFCFFIIHRNPTWTGGCDCVCDIFACAQTLGPSDCHQGSSGQFYPPPPPHPRPLHNTSPSQLLGWPSYKHYQHSSYRCREHLFQGWPLRSNILPHAPVSTGLLYRTLVFLSRYHTFISLKSSV